MPIDPRFAEFLSDPRNTVRPPPAHVPMEKVRRAADAAMWRGDAPDMAQIVDGAAPSHDHAVPFRHYRPVQGVALPVIFFIHGGGFVWGSIDTHDGICRRLAASTGAAVVSIGYRLAPETRFPGPVEDALAVVFHVIGRAGEFGIDPGRIALSGDSAGGNIAIAVTEACSIRGQPVRHLTLIYPAIDPDCASKSQLEFADGPLLTRAAMQWFWSCYLGGATPGDDYLYAPLAADLRGFPPTTIATAEFDPLRDEGEAMASALKRANVDVVARRYKGMLHGFLSLPVSLPMEKCLRDTAERLREAFRK